MAGLVSLTYDGSCRSHLEVVLPQLDRVGLKATFFAEPAGMLDEFPSWREAHGHGHEVGNGSLLAAALPDGSLPAWSAEMVYDDLAEAADLLEELFPGSGHSVGLPWGRAVCGDGEEYLGVVSRSYPVVRTGERGMNAPGAVDPSRLRMVPMEGLCGEEMIEVARAAIQRGGWVVMAFDGVGSGARAVDAGAHRELVAFLKMSEDLLEVLPVWEAAQRFRRAPEGSFSVR